MDLFEQFAEKALHADGNFTLQRKNGWAVLFIPIQFKTATFIYGMQSWQANFCIDTGNATDFRLAAVRYGDQLAIRDTCLTGCPSTELLPLRPTTKLNILAWKDLCKQIAGKAKKEFFYPLFHDLEPDAPTKEIEKESMKRARSFLLQDKKPEFETWYPKVMSENDLLLYLSDALDLEEHCKEVFEKDKKRLSYIKAVKKRYEELISGNSGDVAQDWELQLSEALRSINGKNVIVTFVVDDKKATGKISIDKILYALLEKDSIRPYHFITSKEGEKVYKDLGLKPYNDRLLCSDIEKVSFGKKVVFSR